MALSKEKIADFGVVVTYWSADQINIGWNSTAHIVLNGYRSEDAKKVDGERPVTSFIYDFQSSAEDFPFTKGGNTEQEFYEYIKLKSSDSEAEEKYIFFDGALDA